MNAFQLFSISQTNKVGLRLSLLDAFASSLIFLGASAVLDNDDIEVEDKDDDNIEVEDTDDDIDKDDDDDDDIEEDEEDADDNDNNESEVTGSV